MLAMALMTAICLGAIVSCALMSTMVSATRSPVMALMYAVCMFVNASYVLLMIGFEFLAMVNLLVYVGALAVLFLFLIMLLEIPATELRAYQRGWSTLCFMAVLLLGARCWHEVGTDAAVRVGHLLYGGAGDPERAGVGRCSRDAAHRP